MVFYWYYVLQGTKIISYLCKTKETRKESIWKYNTLKTYRI